jgi:hypothetical protein
MLVNYAKIRMLKQVTPFPPGSSPKQAREHASHPHPPRTNAVERGPDVEVESMTYRISVAGPVGSEGTGRCTTQSWRSKGGSVLCRSLG